MNASLRLSTLLYYFRKSILPVNILLILRVVLLQLQVFHPHVGLAREGVIVGGAPNPQAFPVENSAFVHTVMQDGHGAVIDRLSARVLPTTPVNLTRAAAFAHY